MKVTLYCIVCTLAITNFKFKSKVSPGSEFVRRDFHSSLGQKSRSKFGVKRRRHRHDRQVLGRDSPVLPRHVRVKRVPGLCDSAAQHAAVAGADGVLVFHVRAEGVGRPVDLAALRTRPRIGGSNAHHVEFAANCKYHVKWCFMEKSNPAIFSLATLDSCFKRIVFSFYWIGSQIFFLFSDCLVSWKYIYQYLLTNCYNCINTKNYLTKNIDRDKIWVEIGIKFNEDCWIVWKKLTIKQKDGWV